MRRLAIRTTATQQRVTEPTPRHRRHARHAYASIILPATLALILMMAYAADGRSTSSFNHQLVKRPTGLPLLFAAPSINI